LAVVGQPQVNGVSMEMASGLLGHARIATTLIDSMQALARKIRVAQ
jgi:hypothetical protein